MAPRERSEQGHCVCPYCDAELEGGPICQACKINIFYCPKCHKPVPCESEACPYCGAKIKQKSD